MYGSSSQSSSQSTDNTLETCISNFISTESEYVDQLGTLKNYYLSKLKDDFPGDPIEGLIKIIAALLDFHTKLGKKLNHKLNAREIGELLIEYRTSFQIYAVVSSKNFTFICYLNELEDSNPRIREKINTLQQKCEFKSITLLELIARPENRFNEYIDLLNKLKDISPSDSELFNVAEESMKEIINNMNQIKADLTIGQQIIQHQDKIIRLPFDQTIGLIGYGRIVTENNVRFKLAPESDASDRYLILFDKILLICKQISNNTFEYNGCLVVNDFTVSNTWLGPIATTSSDICKTSRHPVFLKHNICGCIHTAYFDSESDARNWFEFFQKAIDNGNPSSCRTGNNKHCFLQKSYPINSVCDHCHKVMPGNIYQGYSCFKCSLNVHKDCISRNNLKKCKLSELK